MSDKFARADHIHTISLPAPNAVPGGFSVNFARADHVHNVPLHPAHILLGLLSKLRVTRPRDYTLTSNGTQWNTTYTVRI